jgi:hypothetical protein
MFEDRRQFPGVIRNRCHGDRGPSSLVLGISVVALLSSGCQTPAPVAPAAAGPQTLAQMEASKEKLVIPLGEVGIADWSFLNPRSAEQLDPAELCKTNLVFRNDSLGRTYVVEVQVPREIAATTTRADDLVRQILDIRENWSIWLSEDRRDPAEQEQKAKANIEAIRRIVSTEHEVGTPQQETYLSRIRSVINEPFDSYGGLQSNVLSVPQPPGAAVPEHGLLTSGERQDLEQGRTVDLGDFSLSPCPDTGHCLAVAVLAPQGLAVLPATVFDPQRDCGTSPGAGRDGLDAELYRFDVRFFDDVETPTYGKGYLFIPAMSGGARMIPTPVEPDNVVAVTLNASVGAKRDPDPQRFIEGDELPKDKKEGDVRPYSVERPFTGDTRSSFTGAGSAELAATLGARADGKLNFVYKSGDLGGVDSDGSVKVSTFQFNVYGLAAHLLFGRTEFLKPSSGLAMALSGEGFQISRKGYSVGYLAERESESRVANHEDRDSRQIFATADLLNTWRAGTSPGTSASPDRPQRRRRDGREAIPTNLNVFATWGEEESDAASGPYEHWTLGGEGGVRVVRLPCLVEDAPTACDGFAWKLSLAAYRSEREAGSGASIVDGRGHVGLLGVDLSRIRISTKAGKPTTKSPYTTYFGYGYGTGDDPSTPKVDEGFIGKTASFKPDKLFLSSLAANSSTDVGDERMGQIGPSLANKRYFTARLTSSAHSLIDLFLGAIGVEEDIAASKTIVAFHDYRFNEDVFGETEAGREYSLEFQTEAPKGVSISLGGALFETGKALRDVLQDDVWTIFSSVRVTIK